MANSVVFSLEENEISVPKEVDYSLVNSRFDQLQKIIN